MGEYREHRGDHQRATEPDPKHVVEFVVPPSRRPTVVRIERYDPGDAGTLEDRYPALVARNYEGDPFVILLTPGGVAGGDTHPLTSRPRAASGDGA